MYGGGQLPPYKKGDIMAQYWYKKDKRIKRLSEQHDDRDVIKQVKALKDKGYVKISDKRNPEGSIVEQPKPAPKTKKKAKSKAKKK
tara:strand:+ start:367 stop:624 length:258 start_codon:yes stop_codon:yes gene_type:complete